MSSSNSLHTLPTGKTETLKLYAVEWSLEMFKVIDVESLNLEIDLISIELNNSSALLNISLSNIGFPSWSKRVIVFTPLNSSDFSMEYV